MLLESNGIAIHVAKLLCANVSHVIFCHLLGNHCEHYSQIDVVDLYFKLSLFYIAAYKSVLL